MEHLSWDLLHRSRPGSLLPHFTILLHVSEATRSYKVGLLTLHSTSVGCFGLGFILDMKGLSQRRRAQIGLYTVVILNVGVYIWSIIMQTKFNRNDPGAIDWDDSLYASSFLPYFFVQTTGPLSQSYMYWLLSSFATDAQGEFSATIKWSDLRILGLEANSPIENVRNGAAFRCIEAVGQAIAYGMNTQTTNDPMIGL